MTVFRRLHVANSAQRNAMVAAGSVSPPEPPTVGKAGRPAEFRRYVTAGDGRLDADLVSMFGDDYAKALVDGDPEIDLAVVGRFIEGTQSMYLSGSGEPLFTAPRLVEITYGADGRELERRDPIDVEPTITDAVPLRWTGRKIPKADVVHKYVIRRTMQLQHVDGVTFDFLHAMAKELADEGVMVLLGAGTQGKDPIVLQLNGTSYRGFLEGRVDGDGYLLLLHLSNMELKRPVRDSGNEEES